MKRWSAPILLALLLTAPSFANAQVNNGWYLGPQPDMDARNPYEYRDVNNAQLLQLVAYAMTPAGVVMEWGITRPLHYLATQTPLAPILSGDKDHYFFGQNNNADLVPPGTFAPAPMNLSNTFVPSGPEPKSHLDEALIPSSSKAGQAAIH